MPEVPAGLRRPGAQPRRGQGRHGGAQDQARQERQGAHGPAGQGAQGRDEQGRAEAEQAQEQGGDEVALQGAPQDRQVAGQGPQVDPGAAQECGGPVAQGVEPVGQGALPGVEPAGLLAQAPLVALGVEFGQGGGGLDRRGRQNEDEHEDARSAQGAPQEDPRDHDRPSPLGAARAVRKRRGRLTPARRRIHSSPMVNRAMTTRSTSCPVSEL